MGNGSRWEEREEREVAKVVKLVKRVKWTRTASVYKGRRYGGRSLGVGEGLAFGARRKLVGAGPFEEKTEEGEFWSREGCWWSEGGW